MKMTEFLKMMTPVLKMLSRNGVYMDDWKYVDAYDRYVRMRGLGLKQREAVRMLSDELQVSRRTLERAFKRLAGDC